MAGNMIDLLHKMYTLGMALLTGTDVSPERLKKRLEICSTCEHVQKVGTEENGLLKCGICSCRLKGDSSLINLARYEETGAYGCKARGGSKWKKGGV